MRIHLVRLKTFGTVPAKLALVATTLKYGPNGSGKQQLIDWLGVRLRKEGFMSDAGRVIVVKTSPPFSEQTAKLKTKELDLGPNGDIRILTAHEEQLLSLVSEMGPWKKVTRSRSKR